MKLEMQVDATLSSSSTHPVENQAITKALANKVNKEEGKTLSTNDFTNDYKTKLDSIEKNAQVNVIEKIMINGKEQTVKDKTVDIEITAEGGDGNATDVVVDNLDGNATDKAPSQRAVNEIRSKFDVLWAGSFSPTTSNVYREMTITKNVYDYDFLLIDVSTNDSKTEKTTVILVIDGEGITCGVRGTLNYLHESYRVSFAIYTDGYKTISIKTQDLTNYNPSDVTLNRIIGVKL